MSKKSLVGDLRSMSLPDVFQWISLSNKTGELVMQCENEESSIMFYEGKIVFAFANKAEFLMGQLLLQYHKINKSQLIKALSMQKKQKKPLGQVLIEANVLDKSDLEEIIVTQIHQVVYHLLKWEAGFFRFEEKKVPLNTNTLINSESLLMEGVRRVDEEKNILNFIKYESVPQIIDDLDGNIFQYIDGERSVSEIIGYAGGDSFTVLETVYRALRENKIKIVGEKDVLFSEDPVIRFLVALELFNKGKVHESFQHVSLIIANGYKNEQIAKFHENLKLFITRYFVKKYGGNNSCFDLNRLRLLDEKIYITPSEGYILSRIEESPCISMLKKVVNVEIEELYLVVDKLYKLGLLLLKTKEKNKSEVMKLEIVESLIDIHRRELNGELELITKKGSMSVFFVSGRIKFIYSLSDKYSIKAYLSDKNNINMKNISSGNIESYFESIMESNNLSISDLAPIIDVYQTMIFYEIISQSPISMVFNHEKEFTLNFDISVSLLYMLVFAVINDRIKVKNILELSSGYELIQSNDRILEAFGGMTGLKTVLGKFDNNVINVATLKQFDERELGLLNILHRLGYLGECEDIEFSVNELKTYLDEIKDMSPLEVFYFTESNPDIEEIKQKYLKLTKKYHPDLFPEETTKRIANEIFETIKFAYDKLKDSDVVEHQSSSDGMKIDAKKIFLAEQLLTSGKVYLNMGRLPDAVDSFIKAYANFPEDDEIKAFYGLALIRTGKHPDGFRIMKEANFKQFAEVALYFAYIDSAIRLKNIVEAKKIIDKGFIKFPDYIKRFTSIKNRIK